MNYTLQLTPTEKDHLMDILEQHYDEMTYLLEQEVKEGDPNDEVDELANLVLETKNLITLLDQSISQTVDEVAHQEFISHLGTYMP